MNLLPKDKYARAAVVMLVLLVLAIPAQRIIAQTPAASNTPCAVSVLQPKVRAATAFENESTAQQAAASTLASYDSGYQVRFNSLFNQLSWTTSCSVTLENFSVVYDLIGKTANYTLEVSLNPSLTSVTGVTEQPAQAMMTTPDNSSNWVGPEYDVSAGLTETGGEWTIPAISGPGSGSCASICTFSEWVAIASSQGGCSISSPCLPQAGSYSQCDSTCNSNTFYSYKLFYEFPGAPPTTCNASSGNTVEADVYPGTSYTYYYADAYDETTTQICDGTSPANYMGEGYYAEYMGEVGNWGLPDFGSVSFTYDYYQTSSNTYYIGSGFTNGYVINATTSYITCDGGSHKFNVCPSAVSSGDFTETYETSSGTYVYHG